MVGHNDGIRADLCGHFCIFGIQNAFDDHRAVPHFAELFNAFPIKALIKGLRRP